MTSNGADFFFTHNAGNSNEDNIIAKYSVSGTTFNYILSSTIGSSGDFARSVLVDIDGNYYALSISTPKYLKKFSPIGTLLRTNKTNAQYLLNWANQYYSLVSHSINSYEKFNK